MKVRVKAGTLYYKPDDRAARQYTAADGVIEIDDASARTLIERGSVIACEEQAVAEPEPLESAEAVEPQEQKGAELSGMTRTELIDYAAENGITLPDSARSKAAILAAIESQGESDGDGFDALSVLD